MAITIRDLATSDRDVWQRLWGEYLVFYQQSLPDDVTEHTWAMLLDPDSPYWGLVAENDDHVVGFALNQTQHSTWKATPVAYLEDLYVDASARGQGAGRALIEASVSRCREKGYGRYYWQTDETNAPARRLYDAIAGSANDRVTYVLDL